MIGADMAIPSNCRSVRAVSLARMGGNFLRGVLASVAALAAAPLAAQAGAEPAGVPAPAATPACDAATCLPALTEVLIKIDQPLSSRSSVTGEGFAISLVSDVTRDGKVMIPAGTQGKGEVVHAKKTGLGVGGELVLAARYLEFQGHRVRLRSMKLGGRGQDNQELAFAVGVAVGLPAMFIRGKHIDIPAGALAVAKTAEDFVSPAPRPAPAVATPAASPASKPEGNAQ